MQRLLPFLLLVLSSVQARAQLGGQEVYSFLNLPPSARVTALGGNLITVMDDDVNLAFANPSLLNPQMHQQIAFNYNFHFGDIQNGYAAYANHFPELETTFHAGVQYVNYGEFDERDVFNTVTGTFKAAEYAVTLGAGKQVDERLSLGANVKFISSQLGGFNSAGLTADLAAMYFDTASRFNATVVFKNIGTQLTPYRADNFEALPFEIQIGISKRLRYLPFRFSVIYHNVQQWNITYDDPNREDTPLFLGETPTEDSDAEIFFDNLFRHFVFNGEFLFGREENFRLRFGYNHFLRRELTVENFGSMAGFTFGAGIKVNRFRIDYGRMVYHIAGGVNHLSIATNFQEFRR